MMETPSPYSLLAELTYRCPLQCPYCSNPLELDRFRQELDTDCWKRVLGEASALGVVQVHFSGGEPLLRDDLDELVSHARAEDLYCHLITSAVKADHARLEQLKEAGLDAIQISLQDSRQVENDWMAGARSFDIKQSAIQAARQLGFPVTLNIVLHRHNLGQLEEMIELEALVACHTRNRRLACEVGVRKRLDHLPPELVRVVLPSHPLDSRFPSAVLESACPRSGVRGHRRVRLSSSGPYFCTHR